MKVISPDTHFENKESLNTSIYKAFCEAETYLKTLQSTLSARISVYESLKLQWVAVALDADDARIVVKLDEPLNDMNYISAVGSAKC